MQQFSSQTKLKVIFGSVEVEFDGVWMAYYAVNSMLNLTWAVLLYCG